MAAPGAGPTVRPMGPVEWFLLVALSIVWGGSFFFAEIALEALPPLTLVLLRVGLAVLVLHAVLPLVGLRFPLEPRLLGAFLVMGTCNNVVPFSLIVWGQTEITGALASILNATTPLFGVVVAHLWTTDERLTASKLAGVLLGLLGVALMVGPSALGGLGESLWAQLAILGAALSYAISGVYARRFRTLPPLVTATGQLSASALVMLVLACAIDRPWTLPMPGLLPSAAVLGIALLSTALAYLMYFRILRTAGATNLLLVTFLVPVSAILLGVPLLGERLEAHQLAGFALIGLGLLAIDGRPLAFARRAVVAERR